MVGIVIVSHSARLAEGVAELAREMGGPEVALEPAGGAPAAEGATGTDAQLVAGAIERVYSDDGVVVLMDLGSAILSAEMALDLLPREWRARVLLCPAPLVEGAVAAAAVARTGAALEEVAAEAAAAMRAKTEHLGAAAPEGPVREAEAAEGGPSIRLVVKNPLGLHARPAARFVQTVALFDAKVSVQNTATGKGPASGRSLNGLATLGVRQGHEILVSARGAQATEALASIQELADRDFDDVAPAPAPAAARTTPIDAPKGAMSGLAASPGIAVGAARHLRRPAVEVPESPAGDPADEWGALEAAIEEARRDIREQRTSVAARAGSYEAAILDAHLLFLEDEEILGPARRGVFDDGRDAARAWRDAADAVVARYRGLDDDYLRARADDLEGVATSVLEHLMGVGAPPSVADPGILVAPTLTPTDTIRLDPSMVRGVATAGGGPTSHAAILARSLGIPAVVGLGDGVVSVREGTRLILDGDTGAVVVDPPPDVVERYAERASVREKAEGQARRQADRPAETRDGRRMEVAANVGSPDEAAVAVAAGADGIGLLRTEFLFLDRDRMPDEEEQEAAYRAVAELLDGKSLIIRTLDVGADKPLPYLPIRPEANPFMGVRGIRLALARPDLLATQLRAVLRVATNHPVKVMFPMVTSVDEFRSARRLLEEARAATPGGRALESFEVGVMVETPAVALVAEAFAPEVDFFSIGTNDLTQYVAAAERGNEAVAALADPVHPAVLRLIRGVVAAAQRGGRWVGVCGEAAADLGAVPLLLGLGITELSVAPPAVPLVKQAVRAIDLRDAEAMASVALEMASSTEVRQLVEDRSAEASAPRERR